MAEEFAFEVDRRREALRLVDEEGLSVGDAAERVGRSRRWLSKWLQRRKAGEGIESRSRIPKNQPTAISPSAVRLVLSYRDRLEASPVASVGGLAILAAMERDGIDSVPSERTIERVLTKAGRTRPSKKRARSSNRLPLPTVGTAPGVWQQADWIQDRYLVGGAIFNSLTITDVGSEAICAGQHSRRTLLNAVTTLIEVAWPLMSIPQAISVDNAFAGTTHPNNPWTLWTRTCLFFGVEVVVSPPGELGWTNHVEAGNNLWQARTIDRHYCPDIDAVRDISDVACDWFNTQRPILNPHTCGTRYPVEHIANHHPKLRWLPPAAINDHLDTRGQLNVPISTGRVTFLRRVEQETITIAHRHWPTPRLPEGALVIASVTTSDQKISLRHQGEPLAEYPYPITKPVVESYYPPHPTSIYHHA